MTTIIDKDLASCDFFDNPYEALELINNAKKIDFLSPSFSMREKKIHNIYKTVYNPKRHEEISTVIVDYEMPSMKGLEFCEKVQNPHIRKILYTGVADEGIAIQAFNKGLIDGYIRKGDPNQSVVLNDFVRESQLKYFKSLTDTSIDSILREYSTSNPGDTAFYDPAFIEYFHGLIKKHNICEYYLNELEGGFVFLSLKGKPSSLFTYSQEGFNDLQSDFLGTLQDSLAAGKKVSSSLIKDLEENRRTICWPFCGDNMHPDPENWEEYAYPVQIIKGKQPYYVAYVPDADYVGQLEIVSFDKYRRSL